MNSGSSSLFKNIFFITGLIFSAAGAVLAGLLICKHVFPELCAEGSLGCGVGGTDGCANLGKSDFSKVFGIPLAIPGFIYYIFVFLLFLEGYRQKSGPVRNQVLYILAGLAAFGVIMDGILGYLNFFILPVPCMLCAYSYLATSGLAVSALVLYFSEKKPAASL